MVTIKATIFYERKFWVITFERTDKDGYAIAKHIFGKEPTDPEVYDFVLKEYHLLKFGTPQEFTLQIKRLNPKRLKREAKKEMERAKEEGKPSSFAQDYMREQLEQNKKERKTRTRQEKREHQQAQFDLKQEKRKQKRKGH